MKVSSIGDIFFITAMLEDLQDTVKVKSFHFSNLAHTKKTKKMTCLWTAKKRRKKTRIFHEKNKDFFHVQHTTHTGLEFDAWGFFVVEIWLHFRFGGRSWVGFTHLQYTNFIPLTAVDDQSITNINSSRYLWTFPPFFQCILNSKHRT